MFFLLLSRFLCNKRDNSSDKLYNLSDENGEKSCKFWVCFMLDHLFHDCIYKDAFVFKGGTSLSKSYHVIERFSEDIDLILEKQ